MSKSHYTSASAGTGKTTKLTETLAKIVSSPLGGREPRAIVTSFTKAAASELKTRTRKVLVSQQKFAELQRLDAFQISTVNGVADAFIRKYWHLLGLSPDMTLVTQDGIEELLVSLMPAKTDAELEMLAKIRRTLVRADSNLDGPILKLVEQALAHGIDEAAFITDLDQCRAEAARIYCGTLKEKDFRDSQVDINVFLAGQTAKGVSSDAHLDRVKICSELDSSSFGIDWLKVYSKYPKPPKAMAPFVLDVYQSDELCTLLRSYIGYVCDRAEQLYVSVEDQKREHCILTYADQEAYFLKLLSDSDEAKTEIRSTYTHLFVDEFQDSSSRQVKIFQKLAELIGEENCYYYGDSKQVIYSWRAADPSLTEAVAQSMVAEPPLVTCYRSDTKIINFVNNFFKNSFPGLSVSSGSTSDGDLEIWKEEDIANHISALICGGLKPSDVAVLGRSTNDLKPVATSLKKNGIPYHIKQKETKYGPFDGPSRETVLVSALLSLLLNKDDAMHTAVALELTEAGYNLNKIIEEILLNGLGSLTGISLIRKVREISKKTDSMSVFEAVQAVVCSTGLFEDCNHRADGGARKSALSEILQKAKQYEDGCVNDRKPSTIQGFIDVLLKDRRNPSGDKDGVELSTIHSAKGLEWPVVIVLPDEINSLDDDKIAENDIYGKVCVCKDSVPTPACLYPPVHVGFFAPKFCPQPSIKISSSLMASGSISWKFVDQVLRRTKEEAVRLQYVAFTRAKNKLVLVADKKSGTSYFKKVIGVPDYDLYKDGFVDMLSPMSMPYTPEYPKDHSPKISDDTYERRDFSPSQTKDLMTAYNGIISDKLEFCVGENVRMIPKDVRSDTNLGNCIHHLFAVPQLWLDDESKVQEIAAQYEVSFDRPELVSSAWCKLVEFLETVFGKPVSVSHELPFKYMDEKGHILTGDIDLVWKTERGCVIVDYKTFQGKSSDIIEHTRTKHYDTQLACYKAALEAAGQTVLGTYLYYPVLQALVEVKF